MKGKAPDSESDFEIGYSVFDIHHSLFYFVPNNQQ